MTKQKATPPGRVAIVGAGVIGLSCAWRAAEAGWAVELIDPAPGSGSSWVAGGMLAPVTEAWPGEEELLELGAESLGRWPEFATALAQAADAPAGLRTEGTVVVAAAAGDRAELDDLANYLGRLGRDVSRLSARELRRLEPSIGPDVRGGLSVPGDLAVDNRVLLAALRAAATRAGAEFVHAEARRVAGDGVELVDGRWLAADAVLVAAGAHSAALHPGLAGLVRPVKGEILRLRHRPGALPPPSRTVRAVVDGRPVYAVPRDGGGLVIGATQYETGFDTEPTVGGVRDLLRDAERVLPGVAEYALLEAVAGLRPGTPDNLPLIGVIPGEGSGEGSGRPGPLVATGHGRNGILLAPVTVAAVLALLAGERVPTSVAVADPTRLAPAESARR
jgi:glycine oxidase